MIYHVLLGYGTKVEDEIALQFACLGNGKRSLYLALSLIAGIFLLPEYAKYYRASYLMGKRCARFHNLSYEDLLQVPISEIKEKILITNIINTYQWKSCKHKEESLVSG
ncbi:Coq4 family protein [Tenacibaculum xiamenense]|uniref:Coq4 family protein n=1 Tax=Tenacibaculum xiamenense TaxID=1261553 RepID=UPI0038954589